MIGRDLTVGDVSAGSGFVIMFLTGIVMSTLCAAQEAFIPEIFERTVSIELDGGADDAFVFFEPAQRIEAYGARVLAGSDQPGSSGIVFWKDHGNMNQYWVVAAHDRENRFIRYVYLEGDYELMVEEIRVSDSGETSVATVTWRVWGLREGSGVREYMTGGRFDDTMRRLRDGINRRLQE